MLPEPLMGGIFSKSLFHLFKFWVSHKTKNCPSFSPRKKQWNQENLCLLGLEPTIWSIFHPLKLLFTMQSERLPILHSIFHVLQDFINPKSDFLMAVPPSLYGRCARLKYPPCRHEINWKLKKWCHHFTFWECRNFAEYFPIRFVFLPNHWFKLKLFEQTCSTA